MAGHIPLLNVGFSNRRRFLARTNQSDKNGATNGDKWLAFDASTFSSAVLLSADKHHFIQRQHPARLAQDAEVYYYNFAYDAIADDPKWIMQKSEEQHALLVMQKFVRGACVRHRLRKLSMAVLLIQSHWRRYSTQKIFGSHGSNALILRTWYRKFRARKEKQKLVLRISKIQAMFRGRNERRYQAKLVETTTKVQAMFRSFIVRKRLRHVDRAACVIQRNFRGLLYGRRPVAEYQAAAQRMAAVAAVEQGILLRIVRAEAPQPQAVPTLVAADAVALGPILVRRGH